MCTKTPLRCYPYTKATFIFSGVHPATEVSSLSFSFLTLEGVCFPITSRLQGPYAPRLSWVDRVALWSALQEVAQTTCVGLLDNSGLNPSSALYSSSLHSVKSFRALVATVGVGEVRKEALSSRWTSVPMARPQAVGLTHGTPPDDHREGCMSCTLTFKANFVYQLGRFPYHAVITLRG